MGQCVTLSRSSDCWINEWMSRVIDWCYNMLVYLYSFSFCNYDYLCNTWSYSNKQSKCMKLNAHIVKLLMRQREKKNNFKRKIIHRKQCKWHRQLSHFYFERWIWLQLCQAHSWRMSTWRPLFQSVSAPKAVKAK